MLRTLDIRDMLLIDRLELDFRAGLNVLTGETGAGKSILLDCLGFVLGWRGRAELVRAGAADAFASDYVPASMIEAAWRTGSSPTTVTSTMGTSRLRSGRRNALASSSPSMPGMR